MKAIKFTYDIKTALRMMAEYHGERSMGRYVGLNEERNGIVMSRGRGLNYILHTDVIAVALGGKGGYYKGNKEIKERVKFTGRGKRLKVHVWKTILTYDEFFEVMRRHNIGYGDKGNPNVMVGVLVYNPTASRWKRYLWDCSFKERAYRINSAQEIFLEVDPSAGLIRHPHSHIQSLDGQESLLRMEPGWKTDYCYIETIKKGAK